MAAITVQARKAAWNPSVRATAGAVVASMESVRVIATVVMTATPIAPPSWKVVSTGLGAAVDLIAAEVDRTDPGAPAVMASLVDLLFVYLLRTWFAEHHDEAGWGRAMFDPTVGTALSSIHTDPGRAWTLDTLARASGTPRATLTRRFAALTGQSPMAYLTAWRMSLAARRLRDGDTTLRQIAQEVGYDSEFAFARAFKRATGTAPGQYRKQARTTG